MNESITLSSVQQRNAQLWDTTRSFLTGSIFPLIETVAMLVLVTHFKASLFMKSVFGVLIGAGLFTSLFFSMALSRLKWRVNRISFLILSCVGVLVWLSIQGSSAVYYMAVLILAAIFLPALDPVQTELYSLFDKKYRGRRFSTIALASMLGSLFFGWVYNLIMKDDFSRFPWVFMIIAAAMICSALVSLKLPAIPFAHSASINFKKIISIFRKDRLFALVCVSWFIMGTANLWVAPYRTNLLVEKSFGFEYSPFWVLIILVIVPEVVRILVVPFFGLLFDRVYIIILRISINICLAVYVLLFFLGTSLMHHVVGIGFFGLATGGGAILWKLWVTKLAPPGKASTYMTIHVTLTGIRRILSPVIGLWALNHAGPKICGLISFGLIISATILLIPIFRIGRERFVN